MENITNNHFLSVNFIVSLKLYCERWININVLKTLEQTCQKNMHTSWQEPRLIKEWEGANVRSIRNTILFCFYIYKSTGIEDC